jgi:hypothetical protein
MVKLLLSIGVDSQIGSSNLCKQEVNKKQEDTMFTAEYEVLVRSRQAALLREAERERRAAAVKPQKTARSARTSSRQLAAGLGCSLIKWGRKLEQFALPNASA